MMARRKNTTKEDIDATVHYLFGLDCDSFSEIDSMDDPYYRYPKNFSYNVSGSNENESENNIRKHLTFD